LKKKGRIIGVRIKAVSRKVSGDEGGSEPNHWRETKCGADIFFGQEPRRK